MPTRLGMAVNRTQREFLKQLALDLRPLGHDLHYQEKIHRRMTFGWLEGGLRGDHGERAAGGARGFETSDEADDSPVNRIHSSVRALHLNPQDPEFKALEACWTRWTAHPEQAIRLSDVDPVLEVVNLSPRDERLAYVRLFQNIRSGEGVGRQTVAFIRDRGQPNAPVMGVVAVGMPQYFQGERDFYLGWSNPQLVPRAARIRQIALPHIGQLSLFVAIPPYDRLGAVRLLPPIPFTEPFAQAFAQVRHAPLSGIVCTAGLGEHVPALRKHWVHELTDPPPSETPRWELFQRLSGLPKKRAQVLELSSARTRHLAAVLSRTATAKSGRRGSPTWERDLRRALRLVALPLSLFDANLVATYYGSLSLEQDNALRFGINPPLCTWLSFERIVSQWRRFAETKYGPAFVIEIPKPEALKVSFRIARQHTRAAEAHRKAS